ncbi:MAG: cytochrome c biogenesis protein DipZ [Gammaproteobacteria bacterium]|nr:cytochrome c biogenesis protein DipZ [Gammaproteobacteria bacterium]
MTAELLNIGLAFLEGLGLIVSPCILPILPFILTGSLTGSKKRPFGIILGFILTFALFTFFSRQLVHYTGIDLGLVRHVSYALLFLFGVIMISTYLTEKFAYLTRRLGNFGSGLSELNNAEGGVLSGVLFGCLVAIIWTPCAGPILAAVIVQAVLQKTTVSSFFIVLAFGIGAAIPMLLIAMFGRTLLEKTPFFKTHSLFLRKLLGLIIIIAVAYMVYSETYAGVGSSFSKTDNKQNIIINGLIQPYPAPELLGITDWINSPPLQINQLKDKVVLIDFWTYSCINCLRTLPYIIAWYDKYHDKGLVIIGVHTPEFEFEKELTNVKTAVDRYHIPYPVALDSQFSTWTNYQNRYWPAHYLIDKKGFVVYEHFGEGDYDVTENNIRYLLGLNSSNFSNVSNTNNTSNAHNITNSVTESSQPIFSMNQTPETYLGFERAENFMSQESVVPDKPAQYTFPKELAENQWALNGEWLISGTRITAAKANAAIKIHFNAAKVYMVMGSATGFTVQAQLLLDGQPVQNVKNTDVNNSLIEVNKHRLYQVIELPSPGSHILQITTLVPGLEIYTFTFG